MISKDALDEYESESRLARRRAQPGTTRQSFCTQREWTKSRVRTLKFSGPGMDADELCP